MCPSPNRSRAPRGTLTRERIIDAAVALIDSGGVEALSMPKLATQLGVGAMSLYGHIESKNDLLDAVVQRVLESLPMPVGNDWRTRLCSHFHDLRAALTQHPGVGMVLASKNVAVPAVFDLLERTLADLAASGLSDEDCAHLYYDLLAYTLGFVAWELPRTHAVSPVEYAARWRIAVGKLDEREYPTIHRLLDALTTVASDTQFDGGLHRIIGSANCAGHEDQLIRPNRRR